MSKLGKQSLLFDNGVYLNEVYTTVGPLEREGPLGLFYDKTFEDNYASKKSWEKAEQFFLKTTIDNLIAKSNTDIATIDCIFSGDLINQNVTSNYTMRNYMTPFFGIYGACSTSIEGLLLAGALINGKEINKAITSTSSHNSAAEKQYRYPTEYGGQKPETSTFTVTGAGAAIVSNVKSPIKITGGTIGRVIDAGVSNPNDMGSAMAPAAYETIKQHFIDFNSSPDDYDLIVTGDLSAVGSPILSDLLKQDGYPMEKNYNDCGLMIYDRDKQKVFSGGSGCACSAVVTYSYIYQMLLKGMYKKVLVVATGALLNPFIVMQNETIPCIAHGVILEKV